MSGGIAPGSDGDRKGPTRDPDPGRAHPAPLAEGERSGQLPLRVLAFCGEEMMQSQELCKRDHVQGSRTPLPVGVGGGQHELELHQAGAVGELPVLQAVQLVGEVPTPHVHLAGDAGGTAVPCSHPTHPHPHPRARVPPTSPTPALTSSAAMRTTWLVW